jgi:hypothetical protein
MPCRSAVAVALLAILTLVRTTWAGELDDLRAENRRLRERVQALEAENAKLKKTDTSARIEHLEAENAQLRKTEAETAPLVKAMKTDAEAIVHVEGDGASKLVSTDALRIDPTSGPHSRHWIWLQAKGASPETVDFVVEAAVSGGAYRDATTLDVDVDGTSEHLAVIGRTTESRTLTRGNGGAAASERITAALPRATLNKLAKAGSVRAKLGPTAFALGPDQLAAIRAFDARIAATN